MKGMEPPNENFESEKKKCILSIWKKVNSQNQLQTEPKPDVAVIVCLLKTMGFQLEKFERQENPESDEISPNNITLTMQCGSSKMQAVLKMNDVICQCSNLDGQNESFWSVTGSDNVKKVEEIGSNLLPQMSKDKKMIIQQIMLSLCEIIQEKPNEDANKSTGSLNSDGSKKIFRSSTQPEIRITGRTSLPANYKPLSQMMKSNILRTISPDNSFNSESSGRKTPIRQETFTIEDPEPILSQNSNDMLEYVLKSLRDLENVVEKRIQKPALSPNLWSLNEEIFQNPSLVFDDPPPTSNISRASSTLSQRSLPRSSTTLQKSNIRGTIVPPSSGTSKVTSQTRRSLNVQAKVNTGRTTVTTNTQLADKKQFLTTERVVPTPKRRASDIGIGSSQRTSTFGRTQTPVSPKTPTLKVETNSSASKSGLKKSDNLSNSESSGRKTPIHQETFTIENPEPIPSRNSDNVLEYVLKSLRDLEKVVEKYIQKLALSPNTWSLNEEIFQNPSLVFDDLLPISTISRASSTLSLRNLPRSSTTLQKSNIRGTIVPPSSGSSKVPTSQTRRSLNVPAKVNTGRTTVTTNTQLADKKNCSSTERGVPTPKRRASDIGIGSSQRTPTFGSTRGSIQTSVSSKKPTLKVANILRKSSS